MRFAVSFVEYNFKTSSEENSRMCRLQNAILQSSAAVGTTRTTFSKAVTVGTLYRLGLLKSCN